MYAAYCFDSQSCATQDLVLVHWPGTAKHDPNSPVHAKERLQTWRVLEQFFQAGK